MMKNTLLISLLISQIFLCACARNKEVTADKICAQQLSRAEQLHKEQTASLEKGLNETITNLIVAAKIHVQHAQHILCIDKTQRALTLLENSTAAKHPQN